MQTYFTERNNDKNYEPPNIYNHKSSDADMMDLINMTKSGMPSNSHQDANALLIEKGLPPVEEEDRVALEKVQRTSDIFGKSLKEFELLVGHDIYSVPLIFHLLVGYF